MSRWSPFNAMNAYVHTLQLCKDYYNQDLKGSKLAEPECMEFISALAAGNQASLLLDVVTTSDVLSPSTLALAIAARHTRGRLFCICNDQKALRQIKAAIAEFSLEDVVSLEVGIPSEAIRKYRNVDFAVVDHRVEDCEEVLFNLNMNPSGSVIVVSNLFDDGRNGRASCVQSSSSAKRTRRRGRVESSVMPIGNGMEVTKIGKGFKSNEGKRSKRTFLVFEE